MNHERLRLRRLGVDTYRQPIVFMRKDCAVCRSEGFGAQSRVEVRAAIDRSSRRSTRSPTVRRSSGGATVITCNTVIHPTNAIDLVLQLAEAVTDLLRKGNTP